MTVSVSGLLRPALRTLQRSLPATDGTHVLNYHLVGAGTGGAVDVSRERFAHDLVALRARAIPLASALGGGGAGDVVLTFDDAYRNFFDVVYPMLMETSVPAVLYVPTGFVDGEAPAPIRGTDGHPACTWEELRELADGGLVEIGAHTVTHPSLTRVDAVRAEREIREARGRLEDRLGRPVRHFSYPRGLWNRRLEAIVNDCYETAVIGGGRAFRPGSSSALRIQRIPIRSDSPDVEYVLARSVWLEERAADLVRRLRN